DEYSAGKLSRRDFIRRGTILGISLPVMGFLASACSPQGAATNTTGGPTTTKAPGTTAGPSTTAPAGPVNVRVGLAPPPAVGVDPVLINDEAGLSLLGQTAQYLTFSDSELNLVPVLAESWESNDALDVWTFTIRSGAMFHDGTPVTAEDVVATFNGPIGEGNAGSAYETFGVVPGAAAEVVDESTVQFRLSRPNGAFPFFVSSDNYNAVILPASFWNTYDAGTYEQSFIGSGPWINESYEPGVSAVYVKNENYWGDNSNQPDRMEVSFFGDEAAMVTAFQDRRLDVLYRVSFTSAGTLQAGGALASSVPTAQHRQVYMDASAPPFSDKRVRQAMALMLDRPLLVQGLLGGFGVVGNDHPIWQFFPMFNDSSVSQREANLAEAQSLLEAAGLGDGFSTRLDTLNFAEVQDLALLIQQSAAQLNVTLEVNVHDSGTYYQDYWCAFPYEGPCQPGAVGSMGIVNYGHRGVPNVYLGAPLLSDGQWNASHWVGTGYDQLFADFAGAPDLDIQRQIAGQIQTLLWDEVPLIVPYFIDFISATVPNFQGLQVTGMGHFDITNAGFTG
ncbi:MAG: ABC transporter substrate-binding protein, partial [Acidimicrobiia bacterium]|nr:ABC transporter substrate-binding protein [Acidimicrobiia bacterium]